MSDGAARSEQRGEQAVSSWLDSELAALLYCDELVDGDGNFYDLDRSVSVSASEGEGESDGNC